MLSLVSRYPCPQCERSSLVGTDDRGIGHGFTGAENTNEEPFGSHSLRSESEGEGYGERETFRNSDNDQRNRDDQDVCKDNAFLAGSAVGGERLGQKPRRRWGGC